MEQQPTVLLVQTVEMPGPLAVHLRSRGVHVESAGLERLGGVLTSLKLDIICVRLGPHASSEDVYLRRVRVELARSGRRVPLIALADWPLSSPPSARSSVDAVVPSDLPVAAIAHRLHVFARRIAAGETLENRKFPSTAPARPLKRPLVPPAKEVTKALPREEEQTVARIRPPRPASPPRPARRSMENDPRSNSSLPPSFPGGDPQNRLGTWLEAASEEVAPALSDEENPAVTPRPVLARNPTPTARIESPAPQEPEMEVTRGSDRPPHIGTSPSSIRVPLSVPDKPLAGARVALVDCDLTRADAVASTLRAHRVQVHLLSMEESLLHERLLRKFAPHGIIVDEDALGGAAAPLVHAIRRDPFLQHTQLVVARFEKLFRSRSGATQLDSLLPLLQPLGKAEMSLLEKLGPTCEVEFGFDEVPPHLLLKLLATRSVSTQLEFSRDDGELTWTLGWNCAAPAELREGGLSRALSHEEALDWLLSDQACRVVAIQRPETEPLQGRPPLPLLEARISGEKNSIALTPVSSAVEEREWTWGESQAPQSSTRPFAISSPPRSRAKRIAWHRISRSVPIVAAAAAALLIGWVVTEMGLRVLSQESPPDSVAIHSATQTSDPDESHLAPRDESTPASRERADMKGQETKEPSFQVAVESDVFRMESRSPKRTCDQILSSWSKPQGDERVLARTFFRQAQKSLMSGDSDGAHDLLCRSVRLVPAGPGAFELGRFYLGKRIYEPAWEALKNFLNENKTHLEGRLLQADLLHQMGEVQESSRTLLQAIGVEPHEIKKLKAVSRKYLGDSRAAFRQSDLPLAERYVRRALVLDEDNLEAARLLVLLFERRGETKDAQRIRDWEAQHSSTEG